jgi:hypothetical protein
VDKCDKLQIGCMYWTVWVEGKVYYVSEHDTGRRTAKLELKTRIINAVVENERSAACSVRCILAI